MTPCSKSSCYVCTYLGDTLGEKSLCRALTYNCLMWSDMCICSSLCLQPYEKVHPKTVYVFTGVCVFPKVFKWLLWGRLLSASRFPFKFNRSRWNRLLTRPSLLQGRASLCVGGVRVEEGKSVSNTCFIITHNICPRSELSFLGSEKQALFSLLESSGLGGLGWQKKIITSPQFSVPKLM